MSQRWISSQTLCSQCENYRRDIQVERKSSEVSLKVLQECDCEFCEILVRSLHQSGRPVGPSDKLHIANYRRSRRSLHVSHLHALHGGYLHGGFSIFCEPGNRPRPSPIFHSQ